MSNPKDNPEGNPKGTPKSNLRLHCILVNQDGTIIEELPPFPNHRWFIERICTNLTDQSITPTTLSITQTQRDIPETTPPLIKQIFDEQSESTRQGTYVSVNEFVAFDWLTLWQSWMQTYSYGLLSMMHGYWRTFETFLGTVAPQDGTLYFFYYDGVL